MSSPTDHQITSPSWIQGGLRIWKIGSIQLFLNDFSCVQLGSVPCRTGFSTKLASESRRWRVFGFNVIFACYIILNKIITTGTTVTGIQSSYHLKLCCTVQFYRILLVKILIIINLMLSCSYSTDISGGTIFFDKWYKEVPQYLDALLPHAH